jgi:hypothetical protein
LRVSLHLCLKGFARGLTRERADEGAQAMIDRVIGRPASRPACLSPPPVWCSSSFGHDTPALFEHRMPARILAHWNWPALSAAPNASPPTGEWPWQCDDLRYNFRQSTAASSLTVVIREPLRRERNDQKVKAQGETNRGLRPPIRLLHIGRCEGSCE